MLIKIIACIDLIISIVLLSGFAKENSYGDSNSNVGAAFMMILMILSSIFLFVK